MSLASPSSRAARRAAAIRSALAALVSALACAPFWAAACTHAPPPEPQPVSVPASAPADTPRLVVIVVLDQCRPDYLLRPELAGGTLASLVAGGAWFPDAAHTHTVTFTAPGHAAIATGCLPARAGIPANEWYDRGTHKVVYCMDDARSPLVGVGLPAASKGASAECLERPTLGDVLQSERGDAALVISVGWKDRSALTLGGRHGDGSYWIDAASGRWVTSGALRPELPAFLAEKCGEPVREVGGLVWTRRESDARLDDAVGERPPAGFGTTFPHALPRAPEPGSDLTKFTELVGVTAFADAAVARAALVELTEDEPALGQDDVPDLLCVAFAGLDYAGHYFGPESCEVAEILSSLDEQLGALVAQLDAHVGRGRWTMALTADHGVQSVPEQIGGRRIDGAAERRAIEAALRERFGEPPPREGETKPRWIEAVIRPSLWLDQRRIAAAGLDAETMARFAADSLALRPWVELATTRSELAALLAGGLGAGAGAAANDAADADRLTLARDAHPTRSGDVLFLLQQDVLLESDVAATHGTQHADDRRVPLVLFGAGIRPGVYPGPAAPLDIAPTLARLLGLEGLSDADGHVLEQALLPRATRP